MTATQPQLNFDPLQDVKLPPAHRYVAELICRTTGDAPLPIRELIRMCQARAQEVSPAERIALLRMKDRSIKDTVEQLRLAGKPIVGRREKAKHGAGGGYFLARTTKELDEFSRTYGGQVFRMLSVLRKVQKANGLRFAGQTEFADLIKEMAEAI